MALTDADKAAFTTAITDKGAAAELLALIATGTAGAISDQLERKIAIMIPHKGAAASLVAALETGTALSDKAIRMLSNAVGSKLLGANLATEINALS